MCKKVRKAIGGILGFGGGSSKQSTPNVQTVDTTPPAAMDVTSNNVDNSETENLQKKKRRTGFSSTMLADLASSDYGSGTGGSDTLG